MASNEGPLQKIRRWISDQIVQDVPEQDALCAMDCSKEQCTHEEWEHCERRLQHAAGELMPESEAAAIEEESTPEPETSKP